MKRKQEIPESFWRLFRSGNREIYIEALLRINEEYQYNNYFLSWEVCIQVLSNYFSGRRIAMLREEEADWEDSLEPPSTQVLKWLVKNGWLKKLEDYAQGITNVVIPEYAAVMIEAFEKLEQEQGQDADVYIQSIYAILFSYRNDSRRDISLLQSAVVNTRELNRALQNMLHNMDRFFASLLDQDSYGDLLKEHLNVYVEEVVRKKYHILKTSDNFYLYKMEIRKWLKEIEDEENRRLLLLEDGSDGEEKDHQFLAGRLVLDKTEEISRGFRDIERRIFFMDQEHTKYVRATVTRLNYLLNEDRDMLGLMVQLLNRIAEGDETEQRIRQTALRMNLSDIQVLSGESLYKRRKPRADFAGSLKPDEEVRELERREVLRLNKIQNRYSRREIQEFVLSRMENGYYRVDQDTVQDEEAFEKLILAYDDAMRRDSPFTVLEEEEGRIRQNGYVYPKLTFVKRAVRRKVEEDL